MDGYEKARYQAWWREKGLRESLQAKAHKEVGEVLAKRKKQEKEGGKRGGFFRSMLPGGSR